MSIVLIVLNYCNLFLTLRLAAITISLQGPTRTGKLIFLCLGGEKGMARCYITRSYEERLAIQSLWEDGVQVKKIAEKLGAPLSSLYSELRRGQDGSRLPNQRLRYSADLAQMRIQQSYEQRGRGNGQAQKGAGNGG